MRPGLRSGLLAVVAALMSRMTVDTPRWQVCLYLVAVGAGVGLDLHR